MGLFLLYKGFAVDELATRLARQGKKAVYSGQVSVVTYVVAAGLMLGGVFAGFLEVSRLAETQGLWVPLNEFAYHSVPWLATAALAASTGRLLDEAIQRDDLRASYLNLPFVVLAVGLVVRGFSGYFLERGGVLDRLVVPSLELGVVTIQSFTVSTFQRLGLFVFLGLLVSLLGVQVASSLSGTTIEEAETEVAREGADETEGSSGS
jgi:putative membrane protein